MVLNDLRSSSSGDDILKYYKEFEQNYFIKENWEKQYFLNV